MDLKLILNRTITISGKRSLVINKFQTTLLCMRAGCSPTSLSHHYIKECEGEKNHKKGGLNCVFGNFFFYVLDNCPQVQSLK